jgi:ribosomal-protein-alanine N-acetyltransferase
MGSGAWTAAHGGAVTTAADEPRTGSMSAGVARGGVGPADVVVRPASSGDVEAVGVIERASFQDPWGDGEFRSVLSAPHAIFLVAEHVSTGSVSGYSVALNVLDESEILNIAVDAAYRGRGLGGRLLDSAVVEVRSRGANAVFLEVRESNEPARRLYASRGFKEISRRRKYYRNPAEDALVLRLAME